ncbi:MAG: hypothetical protein RQ722_11015 [Desulfuromonadales bacterium]|nr:hypothetical protein [Desulfuromonadales bacterium]
MILNFLKILCGCMLALLLAGCSSHVQPTAELGEMSRDDFISAMRWKRFKVAASLMQPEHRRGFMKTFSSLKDVDITDVRLIDLQVSEEGWRFETTIEMDYYLLPSVTVKTFSFDQTWLFFTGDDSELQGFFIATPFPDFP